MAKRNANKAKKENKNLTLKKLKDKNKIYDEQFTIDVDGYEVKINKYWNPTKISEMVANTLDAVQEYKSNPELDLVISSYLNIQMLAHFSSLNIPKDKDKFDQQLQWINQLIDAGYYTQIVEALPEEEVEKVQKEVEKITDNLNEVMDQYSEEIEDLDLENEEVQKLIRQRTDELEDVESDGVDESDNSE